MGTQNYAPISHKNYPRGHYDSWEQLQIRLLKTELDDLSARLGGVKLRDRLRELELAIEAKQRACPHRKPNQRSAFAGQFDSIGVLHLVCQYCQLNVHFSPDFVEAIKDKTNTLINPAHPAAEYVRESWDRIGGFGENWGGSSGDWEAESKKAKKEKAKVIEFLGFDPEDLSLEALESLLTAIDAAQKFMEKEQ